MREPTSSFAWLLGLSGFGFGFGFGFGAGVAGVAGGAGAGAVAPGALPVGSSLAGFSEAPLGQIKAGSTVRIPIRRAKK